MVAIEFEIDKKSDEMLNPLKNISVNASSLFDNYESGFRIGCFGLFEYSIFMSISSAIFENFHIFENFKIKHLHITGYLINAISCSMFFFYPSKWSALSLTWLLGISYSILSTVPMLLLSKYHQSAKFKKLVRK